MYTATRLNNANSKIIKCDTPLNELTTFYLNIIL